MMKVLVIGSGGREHAIAWKLAQSRLVSEVYVAPGNGGIATEHKCYCVPYTSHQALAHFVEQNQISLTIVGPEQPLANGIVDYFKKKHLPIFGPHQKAAQLETSKIFAKKFMTKYHIPTAKYKIFHEIKTAIVYLKNACYPVVIKVDGLAAGKGVVIANNFIQAKQLITDLQVNGIFSNGAKRLVIESYLEGYEASFICMTDQRTIVPLISAKDHKRAYDHDDGPNTGGMGVIAPNPHCTKHDLQAFITEILNPTLHGLQKANLNYQGFLFFGVMFTKNGPMLLEYNVRMGDPETQAILPLMDSDFLRVIMWCMTNQLRYHHIKWKKATAINVVVSANNYPNKQYAKGMNIDVSLVKHQTFYSGVIVANHQLVANGGRILSITAIAKNKKMAFKNVYTDLKNIQIRNTRYRTDIGC